MKFKHFTIVAALVAAFCFTCCAAPKDRWQTLLEKYRDSTAVNQLVFVKYTGGSDAMVSLYVREKKGWTLSGEQAGKVGKNGIGKTKEGDGKTPVGEFGIGKAFGNLPNPGTALEYIDITSSIFACDENCEYYNRIIDTAVVHHACKGEDMSKIKGYNYGFQILYNTDNTPLKGSHIFFHCGASHTAGCVAVSEDFCRKVLKHITPGAKVCIYEK